MTEQTPENEGRERIAQRDREADVGERTQEYRRGEVTDGHDALARARAAAVDENSDHGENQPPGVPPLEEAWQREKQMSGQDADDPGLPNAWRSDEQAAERAPGAGQDADAGRDDIVVPSGAGSSADDREDPGTGTGSDRMGKPERADELPEAGDVTQG
ncbi:MAG TPA: hypothetical protein VGC71_02310 [Gaiellales bacterium]